MANGQGGQSGYGQPSYGYGNQSQPQQYGAGFRNAFGGAAQPYGKGADAPAPDWRSTMDTGTQYANGGGWAQQPGNMAGASVPFDPNQGMQTGLWNPAAGPGLGAGGPNGGGGAGGPSYGGPAFGGGPVSYDQKGGGTFRPPIRANYYEPSGPSARVRPGPVTQAPFHKPLDYNDGQYHPVNAGPGLGAGGPNGGGGVQPPFQPPAPAWGQAGFNWGQPQQPQGNTQQPDIYANRMSGGTWGR